ncbi:hypothetical protein LTS18_001848, partial [Coniosporium uncinatum]
MAPNSRIILTRHAQAEHNVDLDYSSKPHPHQTAAPQVIKLNLPCLNPVPDAPLTPLGRKQAASLAPQIPSLQSQADLIVTSPLKRTLQTTLLG